VPNRDVARTVCVWRHGRQSDLAKAPRRRLSTPTLDRDVAGRMPVKGEATFQRVATERGVEIEMPKRRPPNRPSPPTVNTAATRAPAGAGPINGPYQLVQNGPCKNGKGRCYCAVHAIWHYRINGRTVCEAHEGTTALRTNAHYAEAPAVPPGAPRCTKACGPHLR
jgi:hypothetical protein